MRFSHIAVGRTAQKAFLSAREEALYLYGHGRKTDTIGDKENFRLLGPISSRFLDSIDVYWNRTEFWHERASHKNRRRYPLGVPVSVAPLFIAGIELFLDPAAPAVCFQITGSRVKEIKIVEGRGRSWDKAFWFGGTT